MTYSTLEMRRKHFIFHFDLVGGEILAKILGGKASLRGSNVGSTNQVDLYMYRREGILFYLDRKGQSSNTFSRCVLVHFQGQQLYHFLFFFCIASHGDQLLFLPYLTSHKSYFPLNKT